MHVPRETNHLVDALEVRAPAFLSPILAFGMPTFFGNGPKTAHAKSDTHGSQDNQFVARSTLVDLLVEGKSSQAHLI